MIIAVDFDMTISDSTGNMIESAKETINQLKDDGHTVIIWTSRTGSRLDEAVKYLTDNEVKYDFVNQNIPGIKEDPRKVIADHYIDDRNIGGFPGWKQVYGLIKNKKQFRAMENRAFVSGEIRAFDRAKAEETRTVEFVISDETRDRHGTVIPLAAWQIDQYNKNGIVGYQHNVYGDGFLTDPNPDSVLGVGRAFVDGDKLIGEVRFEPAEINPLAEKIFQKVLHGTLKAVSVGFRELEKGKWGEKERGEDIAGKNATYYFGKVELLEFSIVNIPSNPNALRREVETSIENRTRELTEECERLGAQIIAHGAQIDQLNQRIEDQRRLIEYYKSRKA